MHKLGRVVWIVLALGVAGYAGVAYSLLPLGKMVHPDMQATFRAHPFWIYTHVFASLIALALGPLQFARGVRERRPLLHRWSGRVYLGIGVLFGGVSALYLAPLAYGGWVSTFGFGVLALLWLYTGARAYGAIRKRRVAEHEWWMIRNYALTFAAVTIRLYLPLSRVAGIDFDIAYPAISWLCWIPNLVVVEWWMRQKAAALKLT